MDLVGRRVERQPRYVNRSVLPRRRGRTRPRRLPLVRALLGLRPAGAVLLPLLVGALAPVSLQLQLAVIVVIALAANIRPAVRGLLLPDELLVEGGYPALQLVVELELGAIVVDGDELVVEPGEGDAVVAVELGRVCRKGQARRRMLLVVL